jgi:dimethylamine monooxygenase subunit A
MALAPSNPSFIATLTEAAGSHACWYSPAVGTAAPGWLDELTLRAEPPWLTMGTRAIRRVALLEAGGRDSEALRRRKEELLRTAHAEVSVALPGVDVAADQAAQFVSRTVGQRLDDGWPPLEAAALLVPDDLVLLLRYEDGWRMAAGVVCFPSHWSPPEKLGLPVADIHAPVPGYADELRHRVDRFLDQLSPGRAVWRRNWTIHVSPELHAPRPLMTTGPVAPEDHWLRSERQALAALPGHAGILFTIRTEQVPLGALAGQPALAAALARALRSTPPDLAAYRFGTRDVSVLSYWLERRAPS